MKNLLALTLGFLMVLVNVTPVYGQPHCSATQAIPLVHGQPITLEYQAGQAVTLAGDTGGNAKLQGKSVVAIEFSSGQSIGYGVEAWPAQTVTAMFSEGSNTVRLTAVNPEDRAWLIVKAPCPVVALAPTATPAEASLAAIVTPTATIRHTAAMLNSARKEAPMTTEITKTATDAPMRLVGRVLMVASLLGMLLAFAMGGVCGWRQWLRQTIAGPKKQGLRLLIGWPSLKAQLLTWWKHQA